MNRRRRLFYFLGFLFLIVVWWLSSILVQNEIILPKIDATIIALFTLLTQSSSYIILGTTMLRLGIAVVISFIIALLLAMASTISKSFASFIRPTITLFKTLPVASIIILLLIFVGHERSPLYITGLVVLPLMYEGLLSGMKSISQEIIEELKTQSKTNWYIVSHIHLPMIIPYMITSLMQSIGLGLKVMVMSEFIAQPTYSIGRAMLVEKQHFAIDRVFAWTLILIGFIVLIEYGIKQLKKQIAH